jgi:hypothetical protein
LNYLGEPDVTIEQLETEAARTRETVAALERSAQNPTDNEEFDLSTETRLQAARNRLERITAQLQRQREAEERRGTKQQREAEIEKVTDLQEQHGDSLAVSARAINALATAAEPYLEVILAEFERRKAISNEYTYVYKRAFGSWPDQDMKSLYVTPAPTKASLRGEEPSGLFDIAAFAMTVAVNESLKGRLTLRMVEAILSGATRPADTPSRAPAPRPDANAPGLSPAQRMARERRAR